MASSSVRSSTLIWAKLSFGNMQLKHVSNWNQTRNATDAEKMKSLDGLCLTFCCFCKCVLRYWNHQNEELDWTKILVLLFFLFFLFFFFFFFLHKAVLLLKCECFFCVSVTEHMQYLHLCDDHHGDFIQKMSVCMSECMFNVYVTFDRFCCFWTSCFLAWPGPVQSSWVGSRLQYLKWEKLNPVSHLTL